MPDIYLNPDVSVVNPPSGFLAGVARTFSEALTIMNTDAGTVNLPGAANGIYRIFIETTNGTFIQEQMVANGFTCDAANTYHVIGRNNPDIREPAGASGSNTVIENRDQFAEFFGETGPDDFNITPDLTNTTERSMIGVYDPNASVHDVRSSALESGVMNAYVGLFYHLSVGSIYNIVASGFGRPSYGAYRKGNANVANIYNWSVYKCSTFRGDANTILDNMAVFNCPFYSAFDASSDHNATSNAAVTGSTGVNNLVDLVATDVWVDPENGDFTPKAGSPLIGAANDSGNIGAIQTVPAPSLTIGSVPTFVRGTETVDISVTNASTTGLVESDFGFTLDGQTLAITDFAEVGSNEYTFKLTPSDTLAVQYGLQSLVVTENSITASTNVTFNPAAGFNYAALSSGFIYVPLFVIGQAVAAGAERYYNGDILSHAAGIADPQINPADGVDGWSYERPSTSVMNGADSAELGEQVEFPTARGYSVSALGVSSYDTITSPLTVSLRSIKVDGTITANRTFTYSASSSNLAPTANAGPDQTVTVGSAVTLNGGGSSDADGTVASYAWTQISGATVTLSSATAAQPIFTAPDSASTLIFSLIVTDDDGTASTADTVTVGVSTAAIYSGISFTGTDALVNNPSKTSGAGLPRSNETVTVKVVDSSDNKLLTTTVVLDASGLLPSKINVPLATIGQSGFARFKFADSSGVVEFPVAFTEVGA